MANPILYTVYGLPFGKTKVISNFVHGQQVLGENPVPWTLTATYTTQTDNVNGKSSPYNLQWRPRAGVEV